MAQRVKGRPGADAPLGINGLGRIGKLLVWHHAARGHFPGLVVNLGREVGKGLEAVCGVIENDSNYGQLHRFLFGVNAEPCVRIVDRERGLLDVAGTPVTVLRQARNPRDVDWRAHGVRVVVDTTGAFDDPTRPAEHAGGALRGHLAGGAEQVINSAAFKLEDKAAAMPDDAVTLIYGINHAIFDPRAHAVISAASCTTTALAHLLKPLLDRLGAAGIMTASMSTIHAATNSQSLLDSVPAAGASDLRKSRSALNSIILTSTNAAKALEQVLPEIASIGFMADSVRIAVPTESLIILNVTFLTRFGPDGRSTIDRDVLNGIYADAARGPQAGLLHYSERQNVPADVMGMRAAVVVESVETHTRTGFAGIDMRDLGLPEHVLEHLDSPLQTIPVTHAKIFG